jgi:hypothetical protein
MTNNYYRTCLKVLTSLHKDFPKIPLGKHISTALDEHGDVFNLTDKDISQALKKYHSTLLSTAKFAQDEEEELLKDEDNVSLLDDYDVDEENW